MITAHDHVFGSVGGPPQLSRLPDDPSYSAAAHFYPAGGTFTQREVCARRLFQAAFTTRLVGSPKEDWSRADWAFCFGWVANNDTYSLAKTWAIVKLKTKLASRFNWTLHGLDPLSSLASARLDQFRVPFQWVLFQIPGLQGGEVHWDLAWNLRDTNRLHELRYGSRIKSAGS